MISEPSDEAAAESFVEELSNLASALRSGRLGDAKQCGSFNRRLEDLFKTRFCVPFAVTVSSATAGLHCALLAAGVRPGDEVLVDPLVKFGGVAALHAGATPVFADVEPASFLIDARSAADCITERTRAVICTCLFGLVPRMEPLLALAETRGIIVIEDCAQAIHAQRGGRFAGAAGDFGVFSFQASKHLSTGDGGMLVMRSRDHYEECLAIKEHGWQPRPSRFSGRLGWNYRMTELAAAVAVARFARLESIIAFHRDAAARLNHALAGIDGVMPQAAEDDAAHVYWAWAARVLDPERVSLLRDRFQRAGCEVQIGCYPDGPAYLRPVFQKWAAEQDASVSPFRRGLCPVSEDLAQFTLSLKISANRSPSYYENQAVLLRQALVAIS